jgi:hypothetical protein
VQVLLLFLLLTFLVAIWAANRGKPSRWWTLAIVTIVVAAAFYTRRVI